MTASQIMDLVEAVKSLETALKECRYGGNVGAVLSMCFKDFVELFGPNAIAIQGRVMVDSLRGRAWLSHIVAENPGIRFQYVS